MLSKIKLKIIKVVTQGCLLKDSLIVKPVSDANGTKIARFNFLIEDYTGFDISKGIAGNPTIGFMSPQNNNK